MGFRLRRARRSAPRLIRCWTERERDLCHLLGDLDRRQIRPSGPTGRHRHHRPGQRPGLPRRTGTYASQRGTGRRSRPRRRGPSAPAATTWAAHLPCRRNRPPSPASCTAQAIPFAASPTCSVSLPTPSTDTSARKARRRRLPKTHRREALKVTARPAMRHTDDDFPELGWTGATKADSPRRPVTGMSPTNRTE